MTPKAVAKLTELVPTYKSFLSDDEVYEHFSGLVSNAKKLASPELKQAVEELAVILKEVGAVLREADKVFTRRDGRVKVRAIRRVRIIRGRTCTDRTGCTGRTRCTGIAKISPLQLMRTSHERSDPSYLSHVRIKIRAMRLVWTSHGQICANCNGP